MNIYGFRTSFLWFGTVLSPVWRNIHTDSARFTTSYCQPADQSTQTLCVLCTRPKALDESALFLISKVCRQKSFCAVTFCRNQIK